MFEKEAEDKYCKNCKLRQEQCLWAWRQINGLDMPNEENCSCKEVPAYITGAEFGYNKAKEESQEQDYSLFNFVMQYENGKYKCKYKYGKVFESFDGKTWKEIVLPKEIKENDR